jgi:hypothetical protein
MRFWYVENRKFAGMKPKKTSKKVLKGFTKNATLDTYADQPLFIDKVNRVNRILKTVGLPKV